MRALVFLSEAAVPLVFATIIAHGFITRTDIFEAFVEGAADGLKTVVKILPTLIGLMTAVGVLSGSGALTALGRLISPFTGLFGYPTEAVPLVITRFVSASASTGLVLDIFKSYGPDSFLGRYVSIMFSSTETVFYTMAVYFASIKITRTRHTLPCALAASMTGVILSLYAARAMF